MRLPMYMYYGKYLPATCSVTVSVYTVAPATTLHVNCRPCKSSLTRGMVYSTTVWSIALGNTVDDWSLHSIEDTGTLVIQLMVADWPTVRGCSRPDSVIAERFHHHKATNIVYSTLCVFMYIVTKSSHPLV